MFVDDGSRPDTFGIPFVSLATYTTCPPPGDALGRIHDAPDRRSDWAPSRQISMPSLSRKNRVWPDHADIVGPLRLWLESELISVSCVPSEVQTRRNGA